MSASLFEKINALKQSLTVLKINETQINSTTAVRKKNALRSLQSLREPS